MLLPADVVFEPFDESDARFDLLERHAAPPARARVVLSLLERWQGNLDDLLSAAADMLDAA